MYKSLRNIHLGLGLLLGVGLFVYAFSGLEMAHHFAFKWSMNERWDKATVQVRATDFARPRVVAQAVREAGFRGDLMEVNSSSTALQLRLQIPGTVHQVSLKRGASEAEVVSSSKGPVWTLDRLHHTAGIWHDDGRVNVWGWFVLLCSLGLMALGVTGTTMWWMRVKERRLGMMLMVPGSILGALLMVWIRMT